MTQHNSTEKESGKRLAVSIGKQLTELREKNKISVADIAATLRITSTAVKKIEQGDWRKLGPAVYAKGYIKAYARQVELSLPDLDGQFIEPEEPKPSDIGISNQRKINFQRPGRWLGYVASTVLVVPMVILLVIQTDISDWVKLPWKQLKTTETSTSSSVDTESNQSQEPMLASMTPIPTRQAGSIATTNTADTQAFSLSLDNPEATDSLNADTPTVMANDAADVVAESEITEDPPYTQTASLPELNSVLTLELSEAAWMEVVTSDGQQLEYGLVEGPNRKVYAIDSGLSIRLGNANAVTATVDGKPFDLASYTQGDVAQFELE